MLGIVDRDTAPVFGCDVVQRLGECPAVAGGVEEGALPLAVGEILRLAKDRAAVLPDTVAEGRDVVDPQRHRLRGPLAGGSDAAVAQVGHDQRTLVEAQLRAMAGPDPDALGEAENADQPVDCGTDVRIGEFGNHRPWKRRTIRQHDQERTCAAALRTPRRPRVGDGRTATFVAEPRGERPQLRTRPETARLDDPLTDRKRRTPTPRPAADTAPGSAAVPGVPPTCLRAPFA